MFLKYAIMEGLTHPAVTHLFQALNCIFATPVLPNTRYKVDKLFFASEFVKYHAIFPHSGKYVRVFMHFDREKQSQNCNNIIVLLTISFKKFYAKFYVRNEVKSVLELLLNIISR